MASLRSLSAEVATAPPSGPGPEIRSHRADYRKSAAYLHPHDQALVFSEHSDCGHAAPGYNVYALDPRTRDHRADHEATTTQTHTWA
jgi:hypothetical protein